MRIVFIGAGEIGVPTLQALLKSAHEVVGVVTQPDKPVGRSQVDRATADQKGTLRNEDGGFATGSDQRSTSN